jgi:hypothetical protein
MRPRASLMLVQARHPPGSYSHRASLVVFDVERTFYKRRILLHRYPRQPTVIHGQDELALSIACALAKQQRHQGGREVLRWGGDVLHADRGHLRDRYGRVRSGLRLSGHSTLRLEPLLATLSLISTAIGNSYQTRDG